MPDPTPPTPYVPPIYGPNMPAPAAVTPPRKGPRSFLIRHDNTIPLWTSWDVPTAMAAVDQHTLGSFWQSGQLADAMGLDDSFNSVIQTRVLGLISRPFSLRPSKRGDPKLALRVHDELKEKWDELFPEDVLSALLRAYVVMGFAPAQLVWRYDEGAWMPSVQAWHGSAFYFDVPTRHYVANTMEGPAYLRPGDGQWINLTPFGAYRGWLEGAVRSVVVPFLARQYALRDWARYNEVHGLPIKKAKAPANASEDEKAAFESGIANLGNETTILLPQGVNAQPETSFDLDLLEAKADTWEAFEGLITKCEKRMAIRILGQNLTTDIEGGSLAAANVHDRVRLDYTRFDSKAMGALREQVLKPFCQFNYGDGDLAPFLCWDVSPPNDKDANARALAQVSAAIGNFVNVQAPVDLRKLLKANDIPLLPPGVKPQGPPKEPAGDEPPKIAIPPGGPKGTARLAKKKAPKAIAKQRKHAADGQAYADGVVAKATARATEAHRPLLHDIRDAIHGARDFDDLKRRLERLAHKADPSRFAKLVERALVLAELAGRASVQREHESDQPKTKR